MLGIIKWEFSKQTGITKRAVTISAMNFETEHHERHPFMFDKKEKEYRGKPEKGTANPANLLGVKVTLKNNDHICTGSIEQYDKRRKLWTISMDKVIEGEQSKITATTEDLSKTNKIQF